MEELNVGDVVRLTSGGPNMTIDHIYTKVLYSEQGSYARCLWFDGSALYEDEFSIGSLERV